MTSSCSQGNRATVAQPLMPSVLERKFMLKRQGFIRDPPADKAVAFAKSVSSADSALLPQQFVPNARMASGAGNPV